MQWPSGEIGPLDVHPHEDCSYLLLLPTVGIRTRCTVASCIAPTAASVLVVSIEDGRTVATGSARAVRVIAAELDDLGYRRYGARGAVLSMQVPLAEAMALLDLAPSRG